MVAKEAHAHNQSSPSQNKSESRSTPLPMSDADNDLGKKYQILVQKYKTLRRNHRKLAGVALQLAEALEAFVKDEGQPDIRSVLLSCSTMYPGLVKESNDEETSRSEPSAEAIADDQQEVEESSPEKEYFDGFWSKPKIPRTPLV